MAGEGIVAVLAGVVEAAAGHADGDDVARGMPVEAAGFGVEIEAVDFGGVVRHLRCGGLHESLHQYRIACGGDWIQAGDGAASFQASRLMPADLAASRSKVMIWEQPASMAE